MDPGRMAIAGYADTAPSDSNQTEEGRAHNRRVDLVVLSAEGLKVEPSAEAEIPDTPPPKATPRHDP